MQNNREIDITNLKQYLLGGLAPPDAEAIDLRIISDESSEEKLLWAESELMEDYLDETLSPPEVELFRENFLVSAERRAQLRQISLVRNYARNGAPKCAAEKAPAPAATAEGFYEKLKKLFAPNPRPAFAAFALFIAALFAAVILYQTADNQTAAEGEYAAINRAELGDLAKFGDVFAVHLAGGTFRDSGGAAGKLPPDKLGERVLFRLHLPVAAAEETFKVELVKDQKTIFTQNNLPFHNNPNGREMRLLLPSAALKKGAHQIKVARETAPESVYVYNFAVE